MQRRRDKAREKAPGKEEKDLERADQKDEGKEEEPITRQTNPTTQKDSAKAERRSEIRP